MTECKTVDEASRKLMREPWEIHARRRPPVRKCYRCEHWSDGRCAIEEAGMHLAKRSTSRMTRWPITHECHLGLD